MTDFTRGWEESEEWEAEYRLWITYIMNRTKCSLLKQMDSLEEVSFIENVEGDPDFDFVQKVKLEPKLVYINKENGNVRFRQDRDSEYKEELVNVDNINIEESYVTIDGVNHPRWPDIIPEATINENYDEGNSILSFFKKQEEEELSKVRQYNSLEELKGVLPPNSSLEKIE